ncbi:hypothetical protein HanRHA438_Chr17g0807361 [Helianthus annuus]|nr:hypothetical protein HanRHA438_Chr17g0807361 [Helianthus annuus]
MSLFFYHTSIIPYFQLSFADLKVINISNAFPLHSINQTVSIICETFKHYKTEAFFTDLPTQLRNIVSHIPLHCSTPSQTLHPLDTYHSSFHIT